LRTFHVSDYGRNLSEPTATFIVDPRATLRTMRPNPIQRRAVLKAADAEIEFDEGGFRILAETDKKAAPEGAALPSSVLCLD
jgi:hypothetical protein